MEVFAMTKHSKVYKINIPAVIVGVLVVMMLIAGLFYSMGRDTCKPIVTELKKDIEQARISGRQEAYSTIDRISKKFGHFYLPSGIRVQCISYSKWPVEE